MFGHALKLLFAENVNPWSTYAVMKGDKVNNHQLNIGISVVHVP